LGFCVIQSVGLGTDAMGKPISNDLRERVVAAYVEGGSCRAVAARFGVGESSVVRWRQLFRATGKRVAEADGREPRLEAPSIRP
jgi:transposase